MKDRFSIKNLSAKSVFTSGPALYVNFQMVNPSKEKKTISINIIGKNEIRKIFKGAYTKENVNFNKQFLCKDIRQFSRVLVSVDAHPNKHSYESRIQHNILGKSQLLIDRVSHHFLLEKNRLFLKIRMHISNKGDGVNGRVLSKISLIDDQKKNVVCEKKFFVEPISIGEAKLMGIKVPIHDDLLGRNLIVEAMIDVENTLLGSEKNKVNHKSKTIVPVNIFNEPVPQGWISYSPLDVEKYNLIPLRNNYLANAKNLVDKNELSLFGHNPVLFTTLHWNGEQYGRNFEYLLHSLMFIRDLIASHKKAPDPKYINKIVHIILDWEKNNNRYLDYPSSFSWDNHSTAWRTITLLHVYDYFQTHKLGHNHFIQRLEQLLYRHGRFLSQEGFLETHSNHGLNQVLALFLVSQIAKNPLKKEWANLAFHEFRSLLSTLVFDDGGSKEQSSYYHFYTLKSFLVVQDIIKNIEGKVLGVEIDKKIHDMFNYAVHLTKPNQSVPRLGDTHWTSNIWSYKFESIKNYSEETRFVSSGGTLGTPPMDTFKVFPETGTVFFRDSWKMDNTHVYSAFDLGETGHTSHGHEDAFTFELFIDGTDFIIDSGALNYDTKNPFRNYMRSPQAHNIVLVNGERIRNVTPKITDVRGWGDIHLVKGRASVWPYVHQERAVLFIPNYGIILFDLLFHEKGDLIDFTQNFQLPPKAKVTISKSAAVIDINNKHFNIREYVADQYAINISEGSKDPIRGWVSYAFNDLSPAPMISWDKRGSDFHSIKTFSLKNTSISPKIKHLHSNIYEISLTKSLKIHIQFNEQSLRIH